MPASIDAELAVASTLEVTRRLKEIRQLAADGHLEPSLLLAWATMEAVARAVAKDWFAKPQTPGRLVETLAMEGYITPTEADRIRALVTKRNKLIHGGFDISISASEIDEFAETIERLVELAPSTAAF